VLDPAVFVTEIALDATHVYYLDDVDSIIYRIPKNGGVRQPIAQFQDVLITAMAADDTNLYIATIVGDFAPGDIWAIPKAGGTPRTIASGVVFVTEIVADATHVYWVSVGTINIEEEVILSDGKIERATKDGATRQVLASGLSTPGTVAIDDTNVYFGEIGAAVGNPSKGLRRVAKSGGATEHLLDDYRVGNIALSGNDVVFIGDSQTASGLFRVAKSGGAVQTLVQDENIDSAPHIVAGQVYYITVPDEAEDALMRVPVAGGEAVFLRIANASASDFEVDECAAYIGQNDGSLLKGTR
jgi:hypothetical protein